MQIAKLTIKELEDLQKKLSKNVTCLYPNCSNRPIRSHIVAEKTLRLIAEKGHVLSWNKNLSLWNMARIMDAGLPLEQFDLEPTLVGIEDKKVTRPLFCDEHDNSIFAPLEKKEFSFHPEQICLLAYRALCSKTFSASPQETIFTAADQHNRQNLLSTSEGRKGQRRFQPTDIILKARQEYAQILLAQDYSQLCWGIYPVNMKPCIASTYSLIPPLDYIDASELTVEDVISFSFLPHMASNTSICILSWLKGSKRVQRFMNLIEINRPSENEQQNLFLSLGFESPTLFISPQWWNSLSDEKKKEYKKIHLALSKKYSQLV